MTQHTPGPWEVEYATDSKEPRGCPTPGACSSPVCLTNIVAPVSPWTTSALPGSVVVAYVPNWPACPNEERGNARLIAAAPELLAVIRESVHEIERLAHKATACLGIVERARALLARIEGK